MTLQVWIFRGTLNAYEVVLKINVSGLVEVKEIDKSQVHIVWTHAFDRLVPIATMWCCVSTNHNGNVRHRHNVEMDDRLDPRETIPIRGQKRSCALVMATVSEN
jgi:hypothetical protein